MEKESPKGSPLGCRKRRRRREEEQLKEAAAERKREPPKGLPGCQNRKGKRKK